MSDQFQEGERFTRTSWFILTVCTVLVLLDIAQILYRFQVPTDGWLYNSETIAGPDGNILIYTTNLAGDASSLQPGDLLTAVAGLPVDGGDLSHNPEAAARLAGIQPGDQVEYTLLRGDRPLKVTVTLTRWTADAWLRNSTTPSFLVLWLAVFLMYGVGLFTFWQRPQISGSRILLVWCTAVLCGTLSNSLPDSLYQFLFPIAYLGISQFSYGIIIFMLVPSIFAFTLVFPRPKKWVQRFHGLLFAPYLLGIFSSILIGVEPALAGPLYLGTLLLMSLAAIINFIHSAFTQKDGVSQGQLRWAVGGVALGIALWLLTYLPAVGLVKRVLAEILLNSGFQLGFTMIGVSLAIALLRYHLFGIDLLINRSLVYGGLTVLVIGIYVFVVGYLGTIFRTENNLMISLVATGLVAVLLQPLHGRLQLVVNRLLYGRRDEPLAVLSQLGALLETALFPDEILPDLVVRIAQALKLPYTAIALRVGEDWKVQAESGKPVEGCQVFPLIYQGQMVGKLLAGQRQPREDFNQADRHLLTNIARQIGPVAHALQLTTALQQSRQQLVTTREEERRRLRRDLHDGLGPQLASQTLAMDAVSKLLERDPASARDILDQLKKQSQSAIQDIRRLVYNLRPPALDDLGLVEALREGVRQIGVGGTCVEINPDAEPLPPLPAAVEVAVYRITQEAIANVIRHAGASHCSVWINTQRKRLDLSITDDGVGFQPQFHHGVGLHSMRERAEELGGEIQFESPPGGGTRV